MAVRNGSKRACVDEGGGIIFLTLYEAGFRASEVLPGTELLS